MSVATHVRAVQTMATADFWQSLVASPQLYQRNSEFVHLKGSKAPYNNLMANVVEPKHVFVAKMRSKRQHRAHIAVADCGLSFMKSAMRC
jgi:hypothetical protein